MCNHQACLWRHSMIAMHNRDHQTLPCYPMLYRPMQVCRCSTLHCLVSNQLSGCLPNQYQRLLTSHRCIASWPNQLCQESMLVPSRRRLNRCRPQVLCRGLRFHQLDLEDLQDTCLYFAMDCCYPQLSFQYRQHLALCLPSLFQEQRIVCWTSRQPSFQRLISYLAY